MSVLPIKREAFLAGVKANVAAWSLYPERASAIVVGAHRVDLVDLIENTFDGDVHAAVVGYMAYRLKLGHVNCEVRFLDWEDVN